MSYIDNWFHFYSTTESFEVHRKQGLINPDSICFLKETGQIYTQNSFFGVCKERYEKLEQLVLEHDAKIKDILGIEGPSVKDGIVNNIDDLVNFLDGFTDEDNLKEFLDAMRTALENQIKAVNKALSDRITALEDEIHNDSDNLSNAISAINSQIETIDVRINNNDTSIASLTTSLASHVREYNTLKSNYESFRSYTETKFGAVDSSISAINTSINTIQQEFINLDEKFDNVENEVASVRELLEEAKQLVKELEDRFGETLAAIEQFERDINADFDEFKELVGAPEGIAPLDRDAKIPAAYLPSYVDDVLEYATKAAFPTIGETGKIYVSLSDNLTYRWSGSAYVEISKSLGLGETSSTAYPGSKGKKNAEDIAAHKIDYSNPHRVTKVQVGLDKVDNTRDIDKPISIAVQNALNNKVEIEPGKGLISLEEANKVAETNAKLAQFEEELQSEIDRATAAEGTINSALATHKSDNNNPHGVTKAQLGLGNVTNDIQVKRDEMGVANGVATLDIDGNLEQFNYNGIALFDGYSEYVSGASGEVDSFPHEVNGGVFYNGPTATFILIYTDREGVTQRVAKWKGCSRFGTSTPNGVTPSPNMLYLNIKDCCIYVYRNRTWKKIGSYIGNLDNTSDLDKPISKATQTELDRINTTIDDLEGNAVVVANELDTKISGVHSELQNVTNDLTSKLDTKVNNTDFIAEIDGLNDKIDLEVDTLDALVDTKVDKVEGKGLSTNDFTNEDKTKLDNLNKGPNYLVYKDGSSYITNAYILGSDIRGMLGTVALVPADNIVDKTISGSFTDVFGYGEINANRLRGKIESSRNVNIPGEAIHGYFNDDIIIKAQVLQDLSGSDLISGINGSRLFGNIEYATIDGSHVIGLDTEINRIISNNSNIFSGATIQGSQIQGSITNSSVTIGGSQIKGNIDIATIGGSQINGTISGSLISGDLTKALIHADRIGDTINGGYVLGAIEASRLRGNINYATIGGSQISGRLTYATIGGSQVSGHLSNATIDASNVSGLLDFIPTGGGDATGVIDASRVSGNLTKANININRINRINDIIGSYSNGSIINYYVKAEKLSGISNATIIGSKVSGDLSMARISGSRIYDYISGTLISGINASRIQGNLTNATIQGSNIEGYIDVSKLQDTINDVVTVGKINAANISGGFLDNILIPASTIYGELTNATIKTVNIEGNIPGNKIGGTIDGSIISGTLTNADVLFDNLVMGSTKLSAQYITGNIAKDNIRNAFLDLCGEYKIQYNDGGSSGTD